MRIEDKLAKLFSSFPPWYRITHRVDKKVSSMLIRSTYSSIFICAIPFKRQQMNTMLYAINILCVCSSAGCVIRQRRSINPRKINTKTRALDCQLSWAHANWGQACKVYFKFSVPSPHDSLREQNSSPSLQDKLILASSYVPSHSRSNKQTPCIMPSIYCVSLLCSVLCSTTKKVIKRKTSLSMYGR